jgi:transcriptional regulator with XRE-family HTH domain
MCQKTTLSLQTQAQDSAVKVLTELLTREQFSQNLTDEHMAECLGITRAYWNGIKNGKRAPTMNSRTVMCIINAFPHIAVQWMRYILEQRSAALE